MRLVDEIVWERELWSCPRPKGKDQVLFIVVPRR
jgi:hypothetical protein